jgi:hypothetical protein
MTDQEIRAVFDELRRIGVDLERPPGLALGTGFRGGEFLTWLRALPDALGHELFVDLLNAHVVTAAPLPGPAESAKTASGELPPFLTCATLDQLEAAIDVLVEEWDPLGARLGELSRESVDQHAFDLMNGILMIGGADVERRVAKMLGSVEEHEFGVRPSPVQQRRYLARRLMRVAIDHPSPPPDEQDLRAVADNTSRRDVSSSDKRPQSAGVSARARPNRVELGPRGDEPPALDPQASCSQCGATGTVAVVMREIEPLVSRYCAVCWRGGAREKYLTRMPPAVDTSTPQGKIAVFEYMRSMAREQQRYAASALWEDTLYFVRGWLTPNEHETTPARERELERVASGLRDRAPQMYGPMPPEIEAFIRQHAPPPA